MKQKFYLLFIFFSFCCVIAQNKFDTEEAIIEKLKYLKENQKKLDPKKEEIILLQLKTASEKLAFEKGILLSGDYLMTAYDKQYKNKETVELGNQLKKIIKDKKEDPTGVVSSIYRKNALALMYLGLDDESKKDVEKAIKFINTIKNNDRKYFRLTQCYMDLHSYYNSKKMQSDDDTSKTSKKKTNKDSTLYFLYKSLSVAEKIKDNNTEIKNNLKYSEIIFIYMRLGIFYLEYSDEEGNLKLAETHLLKAEKINKNKEGLSTREKAVLLNQLSWLYMEKKEYQKSIDYANRSLQLQNRPTARVESYEFLATSYMELGDKEKSKFYMRKYTLLKDSLNIANRKNADATITKMVSEVDNVHKENSKKQLIIIGILALIATIVAFFIWRRNNKKLRKNYEQIIEKLKDEPAQNKTPINNTNRNTISSETEERILNQLEIFENSEEFLRKDLNISMLSIELNTNAKYLSEIIKNKKSHSFSSYSNSLKISYIVHKLYNEPKYRNYKISHLAEICGYSSPQVFFVAFKKINGVTPSYFIQSLNEDKI